MNRRDALKGLAASVAVAVVPSMAAAEPNTYGWPDRVTVVTTPGARNARPYLDGRRVYGGVDGCVSEGWVEALRMTPDNFTPGATALRYHDRKRLGVDRFVTLRGRLEFRTVRADGSWPD